MACTVTVTNGPMEQGEIQAYIDRAKEKFGREPKSIDIKVCGDEVELNYDFGPQKFHRIPIDGNAHGRSGINVVGIRVLEYGEQGALYIFIHLFRQNVRPLWYL